jgi:hypothetical protein
MDRAPVVPDDYAGIGIDRPSVHNGAGLVSPKLCTSTIDCDHVATIGANDQKRTGFSFNYRRAARNLPSSVELPNLFHFFTTL